MLTVAFSTEADVASFKKPQGPGESVSEQLRGAISLPLQSTGIGEVPRRQVRTPAPTGLSGALRARSEGRCRVIRSGAE